MNLRVTIASGYGHIFTVEVSDDCYWIGGIESMPSMVADLDTVILGEEYVTNVTGVELAGKLDAIRRSRGHDCVCNLDDCWKLAKAVRERWYLPQREDTMNLPPPKNSIGYTNVEIDAILKARGIDRKVFGEACGICTMRICPETGERLTPVIDVRRALDIVETGSSSIPLD